MCVHIEMRNVISLVMSCASELYDVGVPQIYYILLISSVHILPTFYLLLSADQCLWLDLTSTQEQTDKDFLRLLQWQTMVYFSFANTMFRTGITLGKQFSEGQGARSSPAATTRTAQHILHSSTSHSWRKGLLKLSLEFVHIILTECKWSMSQKPILPELWL